jgi:hypothetical protein
MKLELRVLESSELKKCLLQFCLGTEKESAINSDHTIVSPFLDDLAVDANTSQQRLRCPRIHLEAVGGEQESALNPAALQGVEKHSLDVAEVAPADHQTDPKPGPHFKGCQDPDHPPFSSH